MGRRLSRDSSGATAVEFALILPLILVLLGGMLEFGRAMWVRQDLQFAVEEAVRYGLAHDTISADTISARVTDAMQAVGPSSSAVTVTTTLAADSITVTASVNFVPVFSGIIPDNALTLSARARMPR